MREICVIIISIYINNCITLIVFPPDLIWGQPEKHKLFFIWPPGSLVCGCRKWTPICRSGVVLDAQFRKCVLSFAAHHMCV